jgi:hypothetical protein
MTIEQMTIESMTIESMTIESMTIETFSKVRSFHIRQFLPLACTSKFGSWLIKAGHFQKPKQKIAKNIEKKS